MCTAISFSAGDHYFGRNLDLEYSYEESVTITPRNYPFPFRKMPAVRHHYAWIGIAYVNENYPLYYDASNEHGLSMAGLNFPGNAVYQPFKPGMINIASFELLPWLLAQCRSVTDAKALLCNVNVWNEPFNQILPLAPLHWIVSDKKESIVLEPKAEGLQIYENPVHVLTNNPPFPYHLKNLENYLNLSAEAPVNRFAPDLDLKPYSRGMGALGLPGDLSSASRFVRAAFTLHNTCCQNQEEAAVSQFFHILGAVEQQAGCVRLEGGLEKTIYTSCCNTDKGVFYYKTYTNSQITAVNMHKENLDSDRLISYNLRTQQSIFCEN